MPFTVHLRHNPSGEVRQFACADGEWFGENGYEFLWTEGNYGCDCNRHRFFARAAGGEPDDDMECGETIYTIVKVTDAGGAVIDSELSNAD